MPERLSRACGSIKAAATSALQLASGKPVEVESLNELQRALEYGSNNIVMLDNFTRDDLKQAVHINQTSFSGRAQMGASGGITFNTLRPIAETGVDYTSIGALTKGCRTIDLSMRFTSM